MTAMNILAKNVKRLRSIRNLTQKELADMAGTSYPRISEIETGSGNPTVDSVERIAAALEIKVHELFLEIPAPKLRSSKKRA
jgi:transcriptional regulator with XRE-family HTH domain